MTHMLGTLALESNTRKISPHNWVENQFRNFLDSPVVGGLPSNEGGVVLIHGQGAKTPPCLAAEKSKYKTEAVL